MADELHDDDERELRECMVVVLASEHPDRDDWVMARFAEELRRWPGLPPGGYQGVWLLPPVDPDGTQVPVHLFADAHGVEMFEGHGGVRRG